jgi:hypothetical protein
MSVCPSVSQAVCPHDKTRWPQDGFGWNLVWRLCHWDYPQFVPFPTIGNKNGGRGNLWGRSDTSATCSGVIQWCIVDLGYLGFLGNLGCLRHGSMFTFVTTVSLFSLTSKVALVSMVTMFTRTVHDWRVLGWGGANEWGWGVREVDTGYGTQPRMGRICMMS